MRMKQEKGEDRGTRSAIIERGGRDWRWRLRRHKKHRIAALLKEKMGVSSSQEQSILPFDLIVQQILVRLPLRKLLQLCCVCKPWNALLAWGGSVARLDFPLHDSEQQEEYWFVMQSFRTASGLLTVCSSHDTENSPFLLPLLSDRLLSYLGGLRCTCLVEETEDPRCYLVITSAGGLIAALVRIRKEPGFCVLVFNCLTGSVKVLPSPICPRALLFSDSDACLMDMSIDSEDPCRYYVMLDMMNGYTGCISHFQVFDSKVGRWKVGSRTILESSAQNVPSGNFFVYKINDDDSKELLAYHMDRDAWSAAQVPKDVVRLHKHRGRLFGASEILDGKGFKVSELQITSSRRAHWVEVSRTPEPLLYSTPGPTLITVKAEGSLFYARSEYCDSEWLPAEPLVYDMSRNSWYVQPLPLVGRPEKRLLFVHRPRLSMFFS